MDTLCTVSRSVALDIVEALSKHMNVKIRAADQIMASQLKRLTGKKRMHQISAHDLMHVGEKSPELACWLSEKSPQLIAHVLQIAYQE